MDALRTDSDTEQLNYTHTRLHCQLPLFNKIPIAPAKAFRQYRGSFGNRPSGWVHFHKPLWAAWVHFCQSNRPTNGERLSSASVTNHFDLFHLSEINGNPMGRRSYFVYFQAPLGSMGAFWPLKSANEGRTPVECLTELVFVQARQSPQLILTVLARALTLHERKTVLQNRQVFVFRWFNPTER